MNYEHDPSAQWIPYVLPALENPLYAAHPLSISVPLFFSRFGHGIALHN